MSEPSLALSIRQLRKQYGNGMDALRGIDLDVAAGDFFALLGPNGAGKSTTIGIISSLVRKSSGTVRVFGTDIDQDFSRAKSFFGVVPQEINFSQFETAFEIVVNQAGYYGISARVARKRAEHYLDQLGLWDKRHDTSRTLSGGMKRRLMIARALVHEPRLLILDEPTAGVDIELRRSTWDFLQQINRAGTTIILTTHYLEEAECLCRNIAMIDKGEIVVNTGMKQLLQTLHQEIFVFDTHSHITSVPDLPGYEVKLIDETTLEIGIEKGQDLNNVFALLSARGISVKSMRNKSNRLEQLFVSLLHKPQGENKVA